jgi:hypothetical protein
MKIIPISHKYHVKEGLKGGKNQGGDCRGKRKCGEGTG